jgi:DNA-binding response OmpR family regulator
LTALHEADGGPPPSAAHILLVEDDASLAEWIADYLTGHGYLVTRADRGDEAVRLIRLDEPDLVVLDINLPVKDGFDVCKEVRRFSTRPILMLTARDGETDEVLGLELGADDFLAKPVKPRVLLARIKVLLRRDVPVERTADDSKRCSVGALRIDAQSRSATLAGVAVRVSSQEFDVLWLLARHAGEIVSRAVLVAQLRGFEYDGFDRSVDMLVSRLRRKLDDDPLDPRRIKTIRGKGYLLATDAF